MYYTTHPIDGIFQNFSESPPLYMDLAVAVVTPRVDLAFDGYTEGVVGAAAHVCHVCVDGLYHL